ncbi:MAG TPA: amidoligase family protein [Adhaeribacter sp.]|nr:amidoligase family protein [Adhaeribacter sp.]
MITFKDPAVVRNSRGEVRKVGFELEFAQVGIAETVQIIKELYGGEVQVENRFSQQVKGTRLGDFLVEIDLQMLTAKKYRHLFDLVGLDPNTVKLGTETLEEIVEGVLENLMTRFFPYEVATPPVPVTEIEQLEPLRQALYEHHAEGTEAFPTNAFGTHINTEVPDTEPETILRYLQAFLLLYPWLLEAGDTDFMRQNLTSFINPFPEEYTDLVLDPAYHPELAKLVEDYHRHNPDRNRPLDLYPLLSALAPEQVSHFTYLGKVKPRLAFHYRLPNSRVSCSDWSLAQEWNNWVVIENLATDTARLQEMIKAYRLLKEDTLLGFEGKWIKQTGKWIS